MTTTTPATTPTTTPAPTPSPSASTPDPTGTDDLRLAIIGFGLRASLARYAHRPGEGSRVTVVCDSSERGRADATERIEGVRVVDSLDELLAPDVRAELDAVLVLTPEHVHAEHAVRTIEAGIPTFVAT